MPEAKTKVRSYILRFIFALTAIALISPVKATDQKDNNFDFAFTHDNDAFSLFPSDRYYTNGLKFSWSARKINSAPDWLESLAYALPFFPKTDLTRHAYTVGQSMFTPDGIQQAQRLTNQRPYAGWLYGTFDFATAKDQQVDVFSLTLGIVGPASMAEDVQKISHSLIGSPEPMGWEHQLDNELGFNLAYLRSWRAIQTWHFGRKHIDFTPHLNGALGNIYTFTGAGVTFRYGENLPNDYGVPKLQLGLPTANFTVNRPVNDFNWYLFSSTEIRYVVRNLFLDGNSFEGDRISINKEPFVADLQLGVVFDWTHFSLVYTQIIQTKEFDTQDDFHTLGSISLSLKY